MSIIKYNEFKTKLKTLKKTTISPIYLFYGDEDYLKNEIISSIESITIEPSTKDFNYNVFYFGDKNNSDTSMETVLQSANSYPFISDKKLVIVKNINKLPESQDSLLETYIDNPSKTTCLILVGGEKLPKRVLFTKIESEYPTVNFYHLFESDICRWIVEEVKYFKKNISNSATQMLLDITGENEWEATTRAGVRFYQKDFLKDVRSLNKEDIKISLQNILNTELEIKSGRNSKMQIEKLFFELCKPL